MACVVAHPDDEVMWGGGLLQAGDWTVICCSIPRHDSIRAYKFFRCCEILGVHGRILPTPEPDPDTHLRIDIGDLGEFDGVLTHNANGEYGHRHHKDVYKYILNHFAGPMYTFGYGGGEQTYHLTEKEVMRKMYALQSYDHIRHYRGKDVMKWQALLMEYQHIPFVTETFSARDK